MNTLRLGIDGISQATPLITFKTSVRAGHSVEQIMQCIRIYSGILAGAGWQWVAPPGYWRRVVAMAESICWHIPQLLSNAGVMRNVGLVVLTQKHWHHRKFICCLVRLCSAHSLF